MLRPAPRISGLLVAAALAVVPDAAAAGPLHDAARTGDVARIAELAADGSELEALDSGGDTPLVVAAYHGRDDAVAELLDRGADVGGRSDRGMTALHAAAYRGHEGIAALLLDHGADIDDRSNKFGITPLHAAAEEGHLGVVELLIARGADLNLKEANAITPLSRAGWRENWAVFEALRETGAQCQPEAVTGPELYERCMAVEPRDSPPSEKESR